MWMLEMPEMLKCYDNSDLRMGEILVPVNNFEEFKLVLFIFQLCGNTEFKILHDGDERYIGVDYNIPKGD